MLIDDKPTAAVGQFVPSWKHLVFCQPYNLDIPGDGRLHEWSRWYGAIKAILEGQY